ncbi:hypothetical protein SELMODRAFT_100903 [Selaginella moellendorffii]|uniref:Zinc-ribbon 15 domain-containing protein n=1 Tax=Selaginella moellendorffii TaxID=88036 RepID=D8RTC3_SELML|nr:hypothetical protein SELMODRAFT_122677 [Selaginella moellendorffii]EFJ24658.1 hypothetical protein SELMODRAFT_100903 [Selaginella moellendorffii]
MFFFFLGGVSAEVRKVLERNAARCLRCGGPADLVDYDKVLKAFFVPVWRWPAKGPGISCNDCGLLVPADFMEESKAPLKCWSCSTPLSPSFRYCPSCGSPIKG